MKKNKQNYNLKPLKVTDFVMYCLLCGKSLINMGGFYVHPEHNCSEEDGVRLVKKDDGSFEKFQEKYPCDRKDFESTVEKYTRDVNEILESYRVTLALNEELQKTHKQLLKEYAELNMKYDKQIHIRFWNWLRGVFK